MPQKKHEKFESKLESNFPRELTEEIVKAGICSKEDFLQLITEIVAKSYMCGYWDGRAEGLEEGCKKVMIEMGLLRGE